MHLQPSIAYQVTSRSTYSAFEFKDGQVKQTAFAQVVRNWRVSVAGAENLGEMGSYQSPASHNPTDSRAGCPRIVLLDDGPARDNVVTCKSPAALGKKVRSWRESVAVAENHGEMVKSKSTTPQSPNNVHAYCPAVIPSEEILAFDKPRTHVASFDRRTLAQLSMHSLVVQGSKKTPILSMDHFDKAIASRLDRTRNGDDIRYVISPPAAVSTTWTEVEQSQHSSYGAVGRYTTVLYRLFDEGNFRRIGLRRQSPESVSGSILKLGSSYKPLSAETLAFFCKYRHAFKSGPSSTDLKLGNRNGFGALLVLAPSGSKCKHKQMTFGQIDQVLDVSRPDAELLPLTVVTLSKASAGESYEPDHFRLLVLDFVRLCSHHCSGGSAPSRLIITDLDLDEVDVVFDALWRALTSQRSLGDLSIELLLRHRPPTVNRIAKMLRSLDDFYNGIVSSRETSSRCPGFSVDVKCGNDLQSITVATLEHSEYQPGHQAGLELEVNEKAIQCLSTAEGKRE